MTDEINFICPICKKSCVPDDTTLEEDKLLDVIMDPDKFQAYHYSCLKEEEKNKEKEKNDK